MRVEELALRPPVIVDPACTIREAAETMRHHGVGAVMVSDAGRLTGIVTDRDLVVRVLARRVGDDARVDSVMSMDIIAIDASADIRDAVRAFGHHAVRRLPVLNGGQIVGILTIDDLLVAYASELNELTRGVTAQLLFPHALDHPPPPARLE